MNESTWPHLDWNLPPIRIASQFCPSFVSPRHSFSGERGECAWITRSSQFVRVLDLRACLPRTGLVLDPACWRSVSCPCDVFQACSVSSGSWCRDLASGVCSGAERRHRSHLPMRRDAECRCDALAVEGTELVRIQTHRQPLDGHMRYGLAEIVPGEL